MAIVTFTQRAQIANGLANDAGPVGDCLDKLLVGVNLIDDTQLASPTSPVWRTAVQLDFRGGITGLSTTPCYAGGSVIIASGSPGAAISGLWFPPAAGDIAVASKTTRLRLHVSWATNATAPGITLTWGLYPITATAGGINNITPTLGTVIAGSTAALVTPASGSGNHLESSSFDFSAVTGGTCGYCIGIVGSGAQAANSLLGCTALLEMRHT